MVAKEVPRLPIYGRTLTNGFNGLLDWVLFDEAHIKLLDARSVEAVKQLKKIVFARPELAQQINVAINVLEGRE